MVELGERLEAGGEFDESVAVHTVFSLSDHDSETADKAAASGMPGDRSATAPGDDPGIGARPAWPNTKRHRS
jgi:hypothetical protein